MSNLKPTKETYEALQFAYDFFNERLFGAELEGCLLTLNRTGRSIAHFTPKRFVNREGVTCDEINLNPVYLPTRPIEDVLSSLVHEMCHQSRENDGSPPRRGYHDKKWSSKMTSIGLQPSSTGRPGGHIVGERMSHYILPNGEFIRACKGLLQQSFGILWFDRYPEYSGKDYSYAHNITVPGCPAKNDGGSAILSLPDEELTQPPSFDKQRSADTSTPLFSPIPIENGLAVVRPASLNQRASEDRAGCTTHTSDRSNRVKYTCGGCTTNIWAKPGVNVVCGECNKPFVPQRG